MIKVSIDIGSNSVLLLAVEVNPQSNQIEKEILNLSHVTSLGKDLDKNKSFLPETMRATFEALAEYKNQIEKIGLKVEDVVVTATEASRVASNAKGFYDDVFKKLGFKTILISGEEEAYYTALGVVSGKRISNEELVIMDMGGASTELIRVINKPFKITSSTSLPVGSVRATDWREALEFDFKMKSILENNFANYQTDTLLCVAGSMTSLACIYKGLRAFDDKIIDGLKIEFSTFKNFSYDLQKTSVENLHLLFPYLGKRAPMLPAASAVAVLIGEKLGIKNIEISTRGLRYGTILEGVNHGRC
jgi:exopolyphosphatase/guanosine-5'-triphosphate,3'-diphosphate pyrophosphatase